MSFLQRYLLITAAVTLLASLSSPMPLSWSNSLRQRRSGTESSATESPTLPTNETASATETNYIQKCMSKCYTNVPLEKISQVKRHMEDDHTYIHPHFLLGEYLENLHRDLFCGNTSLEAENIFCEQEEPQLVQDITATVKNYSTYLNNGNSSSCPPTYHVDYYPNRYPRYLVQVRCGGNSNIRITIGRMAYLQYEERNAAWELEEGNDVAIGCRSSS